jgi:hypothetical protein
MKILIISDIHGDLENMLNFLDKIKELGLDFDVIVSNGDWTDINTPRGFTQEDIFLMLVEELKELKKPLLGVPGNMDTEKIIKILEEENISIHGKGRIINDVGFYGYGGAKTPFETNIEPSEEELKLGLENGWKDVKDAKFKVQVTHNPPKNTRVDIISSGMHVGSEVVKKFIEEKQPIVAISAHIHEARGTDNIKETQLINAGRFPEGYCGFVEITEEGKVTCKIINLVK